MRPRRAGVLAALAVAALLAACSASGSGASSAVGEANDASAARGQAAPADEAALVTATERQVVKNGEIYVTVEDPIVAAGRVAGLVDELDGRVDSREQDAGTAGRAGSASMTVRVPASALDEAVDEIGALGDVVRYTESSEDVTDVVVDLDARIESAEASVDRVQEFLDRAADTTDLLATERELATRQAELESLRGQRAALADQVSMSTLYVSLTAPGDAVIENPGPKSFTEGLGTGWDALWSTLKAVAVVVGVLLPWLAVAAVITVAIVAAVRFRRRHTPPPPARPPFVGPPAPPAPVPTPVPAPVPATPAPARGPAQP